jgi:2-keto-4-pentenoate hydratase/2-oxohepta-3-ene-1,7-dioic acid hydratase in catechol pathway
MRICRFNHDRLGVVLPDRIIDVTRVLDALPAVQWPFVQGDHLIAHFDLILPLIRLELEKPDCKSLRLKDVAFDSPLANPAHIIAAPLNYALHVQESHDPAINHGVHMPDHEGFATPIDKYGLFLKSQSGLVGPAQGIDLHWPGRRNDHEVELAVIIGRGGAKIEAGKAMDHVIGYAIGLDITVRGPEDRSFRKSADSYSVVGPYLVTADEIADPHRLDLSLKVDGVVRQKSNTRHLIVNIPDLISRASHVYSLHPGDILMTGTPEGVGEILSGSLIEAEIETIGQMQVQVR